ncbi:MAG: DUF4177 domain-containing protein [Clostridia bacterium]|nr:DUF4177 domain-containing protein [Clostridia bacterium]
MTIWTTSPPPNCADDKEACETKEYKLVYLNKGLKLSREKDIEQSQEIINQYIAEGWTLQQIATPGDGAGAMIGVFCREKTL